MRILTPEGLKELLSQESGHTFVMLLSFDHADLDAPIRMCNNKEDITYDSQTFMAYPFSPTLPSDVEDEMPEVIITIDNVGQLLVNTIRSIHSPLDVQMYVVRLDLNDVPTLEVGPLSFKLNHISYNAFTIEAFIGYEFDILNAKAEDKSFDPSRAPQLFR